MLLWGGGRMCSLSVGMPLFRAGPELQPHNPTELQAAAQGGCFSPLSPELACWGSGAGGGSRGK